MNFALLLQLLLQAAPSVIQIMQQVEGAAPGAKGSDKKNTVMGIVDAAATIAQAAPAVVSDVQGLSQAMTKHDVQAASQGISVMIDHFASAFNQLGIFQKSSLVKNAKPLGAQTPVTPQARTAPAAPQGD